MSSEAKDGGAKKLVAQCELSKEYIDFYAAGGVMWLQPQYELEAHVSQPGHVVTLVRPMPTVSDQNHAFVLARIGIGDSAAQALLSSSASQGLISWLKKQLVTAFEHAKMLMQQPAGPDMAPLESISIPPTFYPLVPGGMPVQGSLGADPSNPGKAKLKKKLPAKKKTAKKKLPAKKKKADFAQVAAQFADKSGTGKEAVMTATDLNAPTVPLASATKLYQPVRGTSGTSRYFVLAISPALKLAVRWKSSSMAIRVEGPLIETDEGKSLLSGFGFDNASGGKYASMHLTVGEDLTLARKLVGAVLLGVAITWETPFPDVKLIQGLGS